MTRQTIGQTARHALSAIDEQRPQLKYYSLGFYSAWILLMVGGTGVAGVAFSPAAFDANVLLYLYSGVPLSAVLIACGLLHGRVEPHIVHGPLVPIMSVVASLCTAVVAGGFGAAVGHVPFALASVGTGVGTAFLCLRLGSTARMSCSPPLRRASLPTSCTLRAQLLTGGSRCCSCP